MRSAMGEIAADRRYVAHTDIGKPPHGAGNDRSGARDFGRVLDAGERRHRTDDEIAVRCRVDAGMLRRQPAQTHEPCWPKHSGLHHHHQRRAAGNWTHRNIVRVEPREGLAESLRFHQLERRHVAAYELISGRANAARMRSAKWRSISFAFARSTG